MPPTTRKLAAGPCTGAVPSGVTVTLLHSAHADPADLAAAHALCTSSFRSFDDVDWEHALGGLHAFVHDDGRLVAHGSVVQRRFLHADRSLRGGYVEAVVVAGDRRRAGLGALVMAELEAVVRAAYPLGALSATEAGAALYAARGWQRWTGPTAVLAPGGVVPTPEEDGDVYVLPGTAPLDLTGQLACDWRDGDVW